MHRIHTAGCALVLIVMAAGATGQAPSPPSADPISTSPEPGPPIRPPDPVFDNPHHNPRDFEGLWLPGQPQLPHAERGAPPPGLGGSILGGPAANIASGSTLQCTPVWRLAGAGGGMSNYWIMGDREIVLVSEEDMDVARKIYLDARHPKRLVAQPNGHSVGHWEGNTLVVDTIGFLAPDGSLSDRHVVERFEKNGGVLVDHVIVTEGGSRTSLDLPSHWRPDLTISENVCEAGFRRYGLKNGQVTNSNTDPELHR